MVKDWEILTEEKQLEQIDFASKTLPVIIFKHSTRCGISLHALDKLESGWSQIKNAPFAFYYLDLLNYRNISNQVAERYSIIHQSPQIIIIKKGKAVYDISHNGITIDIIKQKLNLNKKD